MSQSLCSRESLRRIEICQSADKILKVIIDLITLPQRERFPRVLLVEPASEDLKNLNPRTLTEILEKCLEALFFREVG